MEPRSRKKQSRPRRIPVILLPAALLLLAGILYLTVWPVSADKACVLSVNTPSLILPIENGTAAEADVFYELIPQSALMKARARKSAKVMKPEWSSSDPSVAAVDENGHVRAVEKGEALITLRYGSLSESCPVRVFYPLQGIEAVPKEISLQKEETLRLDWTPMPEKAEKPESAVFSSSDENAVSVETDGTIRALAVGESVITLQAGGFASSCTVRVLSAMTGIEMDREEAVLNVGQKIFPKFHFYPADTTDDRTVSWTSSDPSVADTNEKGQIVAKGPGTAVLTAQVGPFTDSLSLTVFAPLKGISFEEDTLRLLKEESAPLVLLYDPENTTDEKNAVFESSDPETVTVNDEGEVQAVRAGEAVITARVGKYEAACTVIVRVPMTGIGFAAETKTIVRGRSDTPAISFSPEDTNDDRSLQFESSDPSVLSVDEGGTVTAKKAGNAVLTARCGEFTAQLKYTVVVPVTAVKLNASALTLKKGESAQLTATVEPADTTESKTVRFTSNNTAVATVDAAGRIQAVGGGSCTVTAACGSVSAACTVNVKSPMTGISADKTDITINEGESAKITVSFQPWDTTDSRALTWTSSDPAVATVDAAGSIKGVKKGECTVTAACGSFTAQIIVRVKEYVPPVTPPAGNKVVVLDPGHGGYFTGAVYGGRVESQMNLKTALACKAYLEAHYSGVTVYLTRSGDSCFSSDVKTDLLMRAQFARDRGATIVVSQHYNASPNHDSSGTLVIASAMANVGSVSQALARAIVNHNAALGLKNQGVRTSIANIYQGENGEKQDYYAIIRHSASYGIPAVLVEHCFMDYDYSFVDSDDDYTRFGVSDAIAIAEYLGLPAK